MRTSLNDRCTVETIRLRNIGGIDEIEFHPSGGVTLIDGKNGIGKTSILNGIKYLSEGGHDPSLLKNGSEDGEVTLILSDKTEITKRITREESTLVIRDAQRRVKTAPKTYLNSLLDTWGVDPLKFLREKPKDRVQMLLQAIPIELTDEHKATIREAGLPPSDFEVKHPLILISDARKQVYDERTFVNRSAREARAAAEKNRESLPADWGRDNHAEELKSLELLQSGLTQERDNERRAADRTRDTNMREIDNRFANVKHDIESKLKDAVAELDRKCDADIHTLDLELERAIAALKEEHKKKVDARTKAKQDKATEVRNTLQANLDTHREAHGSDLRTEEQAHSDAIRQIENMYGPALQEVAVKIERLAVLAESEKSFRTLADQAQGFDQEADDREVQSAKLSGLIERIDAIKSELLSDLPAGLEIRDGEIYRNGILFERLNTAQQMLLSVQLAKLRETPVSLMLIDRAESWDDERLQIVDDLAREYNLQPCLFRTVSGQKELHIHSLEESEVAV